MTNGDWVRAKTNDALAEWLVLIETCILERQPNPERLSLKTDWLDWLNQERQIADCVCREDLLRFALWVAKEVTISDETAEARNVTFDSFAELVCRKLNKLGIVQVDETGRYWQFSYSSEETDD